MSESSDLSRRRYESLFQQLDDGFCFLEVLLDEQGQPSDYRFLETNPAFEDHTGLRNVTGHTALELLPELDRSWIRRYGEVALTGVPIRFENHEPTMGGRRFEVYATRVGDPELRQVALVFKNVTARYAAEQARDELLRRTRAAQAEAEAERQKLHDTFMQAPIAISMLEGPNHRFTFANPRYRELVGGRDVVGKPLREALPDVVSYGFDQMMAEVMRTGEPYVGRELPVELRDGEVILDFVYQPKRNLQGEIDGVLAIVTDVTAQVRARHQAEALAHRLTESEARLRRVIEVTGVGSWEVDRASQTLQMDRRFRELFGIAPDESLTVESVMARVHPGDRALVQAQFDLDAVARAGQRRIEYRTVEGRWLEARGHVLPAGDDPLGRLLGTVMDISFRKEAELAQARLLDALGSQPLFLTALLRGEELRFEEANALYREVVGGREVVGKTLLEAVPEMEGQGFDVMLREVLRTGEPVIKHEALVRLDRRGRGIEDGYFSFVYQAVQGLSGTTDRVLVIGHDVTDAVRERRSRIEDAKARSDFTQQLVGIVSHDLKNPLQAILMAARGLLRRDELEEKTTRGLLRIESAGERMKRMIADLLDFTQAELGAGIPIDPAPTQLAEVVQQALEEFQATHPERDFRLEVLAPVEGLWDGDRLAQVVGNLLSNAVTYGTAGTPVAVRVWAEGAQAALSVHNQGMPISEENRTRLFQPMQRGSSVMDKSGRSVGLGLYIVRHLVEAHGGHVTLDSDPEGTTFTVWLPLRSPSASG